MSRAGGCWPDGGLERCKALWIWESRNDIREEKIDHVGNARGPLGPLLALVTVASLAGLLSLLVPAIDEAVGLACLVAGVVALVGTVLFTMRRGGETR